LRPLSTGIPERDRRCTVNHQRSLAISKGTVGAFIWRTAFKILIEVSGIGDIAQLVALEERPSLTSHTESAHRPVVQNDVMSLGSVTEKSHIEVRSVAYQRQVSNKFCELGNDSFQRLPVTIKDLLSDPRLLGNQPRDAAVGPYQSVKSFGSAGVVIYQDGADLDDVVLRRIKAGRFQIEYDVPRRTADERSISGKSLNSGGCALAGCAVAGIPLVSKWISCGRP
jgi:hypothetical protein